MRLKHIKLSGFKSFVDTTKVTVPNNLIGIVGPNGCGKSNVIDAIRWVMGESSAKTLRGASMEDIIFNGSSTRKPVNRAYVELVFDNADGSAPGTYAKYAEIAIRRELVREGGSKYFINKTRCRRKDIHDIFLGTGLGPRSYSIIEQGMVGRIVESKPEDLRVLIEEAAGISKYKERRRETENRIRHTRDNLSRVDDIIGELESQLRRLKRQANEAERFKKHKTEQRELKAQLSTLKWSALHSQVKAKDVELERLQTEHDSKLAEQRDVESQIEAMRQKQTELTEALNKVQADYYGIGGEVAAIEQSIEHVRSTRQTQEQEFERLVTSEREARDHLTQDQQKITETTKEVEALEPQLETINEQFQLASEKFVKADSDYQQWQKEWEVLNRDAADPEKEREVQMARIEQHDRQIQHFTQRTTQLVTTLTEIDSKLDMDEINNLQASVSEIDEECQLLEKNLQEQDLQVAKLREALEDSRERYNVLRHSLQDDSAQLTSLRALQAAALGEDNEMVNQWLETRGIKDNVRVASKLQVDEGWELAVDTVLSRYLNAVSVPQLERFSGEMNDLEEGRVSLVDQSSAPIAQGSQLDINGQKLGYSGANLTSLSDKVSAQGVQIDGWFHGVYAVNTLRDALIARSQLAAHESIVSKDGAWVGSNWACFGTNQDAKVGLLQREAKIEKLIDSTDAAERDLQKLQYQGEQAQGQIAALESGREQTRSEFRNRSHRRTELHNTLSAIEARGTELLAQRAGLLVEQQELGNQLAGAKDEIGLANKLMQDARLLAGDFDQRRQQLAEQRQQLSMQLEETRVKERTARDQQQAKQIEFERLQSNTRSLTESITRLQQQLEGQSARRAELKDLLEKDEDPSKPLTEQLQVLLENRLEVEKHLTKARNELSGFENDMQSADQQRLGFDRLSKTARDSLEQVRMQRQEVLVRRDTIAEQFEKSTDQIIVLQQEMSEDCDLESVEQGLHKVANKIDRIGAVNLVAIDEYEQCAERKMYLDSQNADLVEAMATLEAAINKIDKETRTRFKETFDTLNEGFRQFFPKLFGGGSAYLELTGNDMLDTGVGVMARPPGKRNSTIALLSGGEKALTAVSLLFAFFELNPAPFCVLDEVDAPLDDANVERYANVLKQLGEKTQLLFITHNKITMEVSDVLIGVTMAEPGVSRLVAVDVAEAAAMATQ